jgi:hypothetical protein
MKRTSMMMKAILLVASLFTCALAMDARAVTINIVSDTTWTVSDSNGTDLGNAQNVCLNATTPSNCPPGAMPYGYTLGGWTADLSSIPGATWIWAPNITGATSPAANAEFTFQKEFYLCGAPKDGTISVAADDLAEVILNGAAATVLTSTSHAVLSSASIPASNFAQGLNIIQVKVKNGLNPSNCGSGQYQCNPAGVVLGASFADALNALPTCTSNGSTFTVGEFEALSCPPGQTGSKSRPCICIGSNGLWGPPYSTCATPPPTCTGNNASTFSVGDTETLSCPPGLTGSASRTCQSNGSWGPTNSSTCVPPPTTCTGNGGTLFTVGQAEMLSCPPGLSGSRSRTCLSSGSWGATVDSCVLPPATAGGICGSSDKGVTAICPSGTMCGSRALPVAPRPWWCFFFNFTPFIAPSECRPDRLQTTDWFCNP